jgi:hypothetical protein
MSSTKQTPGMKKPGHLWRPGRLLRVNEKF